MLNYIMKNAGIIFNDNTLRIDSKTNVLSVHVCCNYAKPYAVIDNIRQKKICV